jgi:hypothetical protein
MLGLPWSPLLLTPPLLALRILLLLLPPCTMFEGSLSLGVKLPGFMCRGTAICAPPSPDAAAAAATVAAMAAVLVLVALLPLAAAAAAASWLISSVSSSVSPSQRSVCL